MSHYAARIASTLEEQGLCEIAGERFFPHHIEAYMRLEHSTLDGLDEEQFVDEVLLACEAILVGGTFDAEALARSFGLVDDSAATPQATR
jgi:hypothetical protein